MYSYLFLAGLLLSLSIACNRQPKQEQAREPVSAFDKTKAGITDFTGRLYTSGLQPGEAERLQLTWPVYQLSGAESYFFSGDDSLISYIGQCIGLEGTEVKWAPGTEEVNGQFTYNRGALTFSRIILLNADLCEPSRFTDEKQAGNTNSYVGRIRRMLRPAPDIAYDYVLRLEEPFRDPNHPVEPGKLVEELPLFILKQEDVEEIEQAIAQRRTVRVEAALVQGYAERKALQVVKIQKF